MLLLAGVAIFLTMPAYALIDWGFDIDETKAGFLVYNQVADMSGGDPDAKPAEAYYPQIAYAMDTSFQLNAVSQGAKSVAGFNVHMYANMGGGGTDAISGDPKLDMKLFNTVVLSIGRTDPATPNDFFVANGDSNFAVAASMNVIEKRFDMALGVANYTSKAYGAKNALGGRADAGFAGDANAYHINFDIRPADVLAVNLGGSLGTKFGDSFDPDNELNYETETAIAIKLKLNLQMSGLNMNVINAAYGMNTIHPAGEDDDEIVYSGFMIGHDGSYPIDKGVSLRWALAFVPATDSSALDETGGQSVANARFSAAGGGVPWVYEGAGAAIFNNVWGRRDLRENFGGPFESNGEAIDYPGFNFDDTGMIAVGTGVAFSLGDAAIENGVAFLMTAAQDETNSDWNGDGSDDFVNADGDTMGSLVGVEYGYHLKMTLPDSDGVVFLSRSNFIFPLSYWQTWFEPYDNAQASLVYFEINNKLTIGTM